MVRPTPTNINCPSCGQPFGAILEQILDTRIDPTAKERLLSGRVNLITCPHCGYQGMIGTPIMYHDHSKQLAVFHVPMELHIKEADREKFIGSMTQAIMQSLPEDSPKGYLLQPKTALTMQGLVDQILEADGITPEMLDAEKRKVEVVGELVGSDRERQEELLAENADLIDQTFLELLNMAASNASAVGDARASLRLLNIRQRLLDTTEAGQEVKRQETAIKEVMADLQQRGGNLTREEFVQMLVDSAGDPYRARALGTLGGSSLDYQIFQMVTNRIEAETNEEKKQQLKDIRDMLGEIAAELEQQSKAIARRASDTLQMLMSAPDLINAVRANIDRIDDTFIQVLQLNLDEARKSGRVEVSNRLNQIRDIVLSLMQASAPPEIQFINDLLNIDDIDESVTHLRQNKDKVTPDLLDIMDAIIQQLQQAGNTEATHRLQRLQKEARSLLS